MKLIHYIMKWETRLLIWKLNKCYIIILGTLCIDIIPISNAVKMKVVVGYKGRMEQCFPNGVLQNPAVPLRENKGST
jgi:hypothetical protein